ncbi:hypothetical protein FDP41_011264 [Naegleria fowleri]|uniref:EF-hand domain-containing protein n=1 Tax=Naegleria fowleri TaxID=5763 RepID=A0A6A5C757_NAEFO|nr:uncharacterized protein FDP41_011264 [Naegleria fowleri]KAF0982334.1 hypothetical protein FDP41_011264 [Naegleria fowleri]CAG4709771.1 unnamed protein product [Naegleria fowleri]
MGITQNKLLTVVKDLSLEKLQSGLSIEEAEKLWNEADTNKDGILSEKEAKELLKDLNSSVMNKIKQSLQKLEEYLQSEELLKEWMSDCDENKDGKITKEEFMKVLTTGHAIDKIPKILLEGVHDIEEQDKKRKLSQCLGEDKAAEEEEEEPNTKKNAKKVKTKKVKTI